MVRVTWVGAGVPVAQVPQGRGAAEAPRGLGDRAPDLEPPGCTDKPHRARECPKSPLARLSGAGYSLAATGIPSAHPAPRWLVHATSAS